MGSFIEIVSHDEKNVFQSGDSKIYYRRFDGEIYNKMHKRFTKKTGINRRTGQPDFDTDTNALNNALLDWLILDWDGVMHPISKEPVPCNAETKIQLPNQVKLELINLADSDKTHGDDMIDDEKKTSPSMLNT